MLYCVVNYWVADYAEGEGEFNLQRTLQGADAKTVVELFDFELNTAQHGSTTTYRFTNTKNELGADIVWQGNTYTAIPLQAGGYQATGQGTLPRPNLTVSNLNGTFTTILALLNVDTNGNALPRNTITLEGCKVTRTRTLSKYLDAVNFTGGSNSDADPTSYFRPRDIYFIDRKSMENRDIISYEMCSAFDLAGVRLPKRQILPDDFPGVGTFSY